MAIRAGADVMPDGSFCFHKHQVADLMLLQRYKQLFLEDFQVSIEPIENYYSALARQPARNQLLFGPYGVMSTLPALLAEQCLDSRSPWFGIIRGWKDSESNTRMDNPLAD
jgi:hypothetical protein